MVADADAQKRTVGGNPALDGLPEAGFTKIAGAVAERALTGDDERIAVVEFGGCGDEDAGSATALGGFEGAAEISAAVVDDADARDALVLVCSWLADGWEAAAPRWF